MLDRFSRKAPAPACPWCDENPHPPPGADLGEAFDCEACGALVRVTDYDYCSIMGASWGFEAVCRAARDYCRRGAPCADCIPA